jgi:hypothetical protein
MLTRVALTDINVHEYLSIPTQFGPGPVEEPIIEGGTGSLTTVMVLINGATSVHYVLEVDTGARVNPLFIGEVVVATGKNSDGKTVDLPAPLETASVGPPAIFRGPYK